MLQAENLAQPLHVAARQLHAAQRGRRLALRLGAVFESTRAAARGQALRHEERAEQDRVRERLRRALEAMTVGIERFEERPERPAAVAHQLRREMLEQSDLAELMERSLGGSRSQNLVELLEQPRRRRLRDERRVLANRVDDV